jgi:hypothetical protein
MTTSSIIIDEPNVYFGSDEDWRKFLTEMQSMLKKCRGEIEVTTTVEKMINKAEAVLAERGQEYI